MVDLIDALTALMAKWIICVLELGTWLGMDQGATQDVISA
jgi:hypothetical protein